MAASTPSIAGPAGGPGEVPPPAAGSCAPLDVALVLDTTTSMDPAIENVRAEITAFTRDVETASGGDYRIALVDFGRGVDVHVPFAGRNAEDVRLRLSGLLQDSGNLSNPEAWDEALVTAVGARPAAAVGEDQVGDFTRWRPDAEKLVVLVSDARPAGFDDEFDEGEDDLRAHQAAQDARLAGIQVSTFFVPNSNSEGDAEQMLAEVAELSGSRSFRTAPDGANLTDGLRLNVSGCGADRDGDGLFDSWETDGYDADGDGTVDVDLPAMGASPDRKDLYVQVNWMVEDGARPCYVLIFCGRGPDGPHPPSREALERVIETFAAAPVENPDGTTGVSLHIDAGPLTPDRSGIRAEDRRGGGTLVHDESLGENGTAVQAALGALREATVEADRASLVTLAVYAHRLTPREGDLGQAETRPGDVFAMAGQLMTSVDLEAATFMHELGHTLGLGHGGSDHVNGKPNYVSVMNYDIAFRGGVPRDGRHVLDYSDRVLSTLDENDLDEAAPLVDDTGATPEGLGTVWHCPEDSDAGDLRDVARRVTAASGPFDWDCNGTEGEQGVTAVLHYSEDPNTMVLESWDDWASLSFVGGVRGGLSSEGEPVDEDGFTYDAWESTPKPFAVAVTPPGAVGVSPGDALRVVEVAVTNIGTTDDTYDLAAAVVPGGDWTPQDPQLAAETLEVPAGASATAYVSFGVPDDATGATSVTVTFTSQENPSTIGVGVAAASADRGVEHEPATTGALEVPAGPVAVGERALVTGSGYDRGTTVYVAVAGGPAEPVVADDDGTLAFEVEGSEAGSQEVSAVGAAGGGVLHLSGTVVHEAGEGFPWSVLAAAATATAVFLAAVGSFALRSRRRRRSRVGRA